MTGPAADAPAATPTPRKKSTRSFVVNRRRARTLAGFYPDFDETAILECLSGFPMKGAIALLIWTAEKAPENPYRKLRDWARRNGKGHYAPEMMRKPLAEVYREYMTALEEERVRIGSETGRERLTPGEIERVTQEIYAPRSRAEYSRISEASWRSFHEDLQRKDRAA